MNINFYPYISNDNLYLSIIINSIQSKEHVVSPFVVSIKDWLLKKRNADVVHFNWFDNIDAKTPIKTVMRYGKRVLIIKILKYRKIKIVTTVHNRLPHNTKYKGLSLNFLKILYKNADAITVLSDSTREVLESQMGKSFYKKIEKKIEYIPHPNYIGAYPRPGKQILPKIEDEKMRFLFLGAVKPYKNIELILEVAQYFYDNNMNAEFVIAGSGDKEYMAALKRNYGTLPNVIFLDKFIEDDEIEDLMIKSHILILPYDKKSSLNSGTCFLAFSYKRNVICPDIATITDVGAGKCYSYDYGFEEEHMQRLRENALKAYSDYREDKHAFYERGQALYDLVTDCNSPQEIGNKYRLLYNKLIKGD